MNNNKKKTKTNKTIAKGKTLKKIAEPKNKLKIKT